MAANLSILGERDALKQVLLIAIDNALKHSSSDVIIAAAQKDKLVEISIQDFGPGIPPEKLEHVFDRFYRGDDSGSHPGFGLGLPIAKSLVEAQNGTITLQSEPGQGCLLRLCFPTSP
jgi:signal transduction histidine kinase